MPADLPQRFCCADDLARIGYDGRDAEKDLAAWRRRGPRPTTQELKEGDDRHPQRDVDGDRQHQAHRRA